MFELKPIVRQVLLACGSVTSAALLFGPGAAVAQQTADQIKDRERVTITGSNIRRTDVETVAPVEIITREQIERTGKTTVADVLRSVSAATGGSFSESFSNSFAAGAAGISLRGLGQKTTLVLINGRRTAGYGFAQNLQDSFVDLNSIPTAAVERIEILKDGASAIYGSDAIAGVVNVILRRDFRGAEVSASYGTSESKDEWRASFGLGFGDLGSQKFNAFAVLDLYSREQVMMSDTKFMETRDFRDEPGGRNFQSLTGVGTWTGVPGSATANLRRAISDCGALGGQVVGYQQAVLAGLIGGATNDPNNANALNVLLNAPLGTGFNQAGNTWCKFDFNKQFSAMPGSDRIGLLSRATAEFSPTVQGYAEVGLSQVKTEQTFQSPFFATTGLQQTPAGLRPFAYNITFAPGAAGNPLGVNARYGGVLGALGTRDAEITSDTWRLLLGLKYSLGSWELDSGVGASKNEVEQSNINRLSKSGTNALFGVNPTIAAPTGTSTASACNLDSPLSTLAACKSMLITFPRTATSELSFVDTKATTEVGELPGGPIGLALGIEAREEKIDDSPDPRAEQGDVLGQGITATSAKRTNIATYAEFGLPLTRTVEAQLAVRGDHYSDFGNAVTPKVGLKFKPTPEFLVRVNWGRGFRAPTLPEISDSVATFFTLVGDPLTNTSPNISGVFAGNPDLKAEKSRSTTIGFVWEPSSSFNIGFDWYEINWSNIVGSDTFQSIVNGDVLTFGRQNDATCSGGDPRVLRDPLNGCQIITVISNFRNLNRTETKGFDIEGRYIVRAPIGRFTTRLNTAYVSKFEEDGFDSAGRNSGTNTIPRWKGYIALDYDQGPWTATGRVNYIHHYYNDLTGLVQGPSALIESTANRAFQNGGARKQIPSYTTYDLYLRYAFTPKLSVSGTILNVTDEVPPYDPGFSTTFLYDFTQYDPRGRQYRIGVQYKF